MLIQKQSAHIKTDFNALLKKQKYSLAGTHSAVKTCLWLNRSIKNNGSCYKSIYGIESHRCMQMTPSLLCNQRCVHCWRPIEVNVEPPIEWDSPATIKQECIKSQRKLISGFGGSAPRTRWMLANEPKHVAISLSGEPTTYPYLHELIDEFGKDDITTFVVSNGTNPNMIKKINPSQLYLSLDAFDEEMYNKVCRPKLPNLWEKINKSFEIMGQKEIKTAIRITVIKGINMCNPKEYAELIKIANPSVIEVKAYMHLGFSRYRLVRESMPQYSEVLGFAKEIAKYTGYVFADGVEQSRVVFLSKDGKIQKVV